MADYKMNSLTRRSLLKLAGASAVNAMSYRIVNASPLPYGAVAQSGNHSALVENHANRHDRTGNPFTRMMAASRGLETDFFGTGSAMRAIRLGYTAWRDRTSGTVQLYLDRPQYVKLPLVAGCF